MNAYQWRAIGYRRHLGRRHRLSYNSAWQFGMLDRVALNPPQSRLVMNRPAEPEQPQAAETAPPEAAPRAAPEASPVEAASPAAPEVYPLDPAVPAPLPPTEDVTRIGLPMATPGDEAVKPNEETQVTLRAMFGLVLYAAVLMALAKVISVPLVAFCLGIATIVFMYYLAINEPRVAWLHWTWMVMCGSYILMVVLSIWQR